MQGEPAETCRTRYAEAAVEQDPPTTIHLREQIAPNGPEAQFRELAKVVDGRFSSDRTRNTITRLLLALTGIVAVVAISLGIKYYFQQQMKAKPPASMSAVVHSYTTTAPKKTTSARTRQARTSATEANAPPRGRRPPQITWELPVISEEFADTVRERPKAAHDEVEAAMVRNNRVRNSARPAFSPAPCLPLPNGTRPRDVDAAYYKDWAREYSCLIP